MNNEDIRALQSPLLLCIIVLLIGGGMVYYTHGTLRAAQQQLAQQEKAMEQARTQLRNSGNEKQTIIEYLDDYQQLQNAGFAGDERRMDWVDGLRLTNQQLRLFGIEYQIGAQQAYPYANDFNVGTLAMHESMMKVSLPLLHEGDLSRFFTTLAAQHVGIFAPQQCTLVRIPTGGAIRYQPNLHAECELAWITVKPPENPAAESAP